MAAVRSFYRTGPPPRVLVSMRTPYRVHLNLPTVITTEPMAYLCRAEVIARCREELGEQPHLDWERVVDFPHGSLRMLGSLKAKHMDVDPPWVGDKVSAHGRAGASASASLLPATCCSCSAAVAVAAPTDRSSDNVAIALAAVLLPGLDLLRSSAALLEALRRLPWSRPAWGSPAHAGHQSLSRWPGMCHTPCPHTNIALPSTQCNCTLNAAQRPGACHA
eukprot:364641-Chlamydomonas_euryale.AAC.7